MEKTERIQLRCDLRWREHELKPLADRLGVSEAEAIRRAVVLANRPSKKKDGPSVSPRRWQRNDLLAIGARLREKRQEAGITARDMALFIDVSQQAYHSYERADRSIPLHVLLNIAGVLGVSVGSLIGLEVQRNDSGAMQREAS